VPEEASLLVRGQLGVGLDASLTSCLETGTRMPSSMASAPLRGTELATGAEQFRIDHGPLGLPGSLVEVDLLDLAELLPCSSTAVWPRQ
jgi:hypothetical protein